MEKKFIRLFIPVLLLIVLSFNPQAQTIRYVKQGGTGNGLSWATASGSFQGMIDASSAGDEVWVAAGDYRTPFGAAFSMKEGVRILGGFPGNGDPVLADRNWTTNTTRLLGNLKDWQSNGNRVIENVNNGLTAAAVLDGFTLREGYIRSPDHGGGMYNQNASPDIRNCVFTNNISGKEGGAMYNNGSSPAITNCTFSDNKAGDESEGNGGGIANYNSSPVITNSVFNDNSVGLGGTLYGGGGMYNYNSNPLVTGCSFTGNHASTGGGVYNTGSDPQFINTRFSANDAQKGGAVMNYDYSSPLYKDCFFTNNTGHNGGGVFNEFYSVSTFINCLFNGNHANGNAGGGNGGAIFNNYAESRFYNCTLAGNQANGSGGAVYSTGVVPGYPPNVLIRNSIIQGNSSGIFMYNSVGNYENSMIQDYTPNGGNVEISVANMLGGIADPVFVDPANAAGADGVYGTADDGFLLQEISPLVNRGSNAAVPAGIVTDLAGNPRIQGPSVDLGAYESPFALNCGLSTIYVDANRSSSGNGESWGTAFKTLSEAMEKARDCANINTILVARGTYYPTGQQNGTNRDSAFIIPQRGRLKLYGGYPNGGGTRNVISNPTILSGDIGTAGDHSDNSYHLLVMTETLPGADSVVIDGFTFTRANANGGQYNYNGALTNQNEGAALLLRKNNNIGTKLAVRNCIIINNAASSSGAGIYLWQSSAFISHCVIAGNTAATGAGIFNYNNNNVKLIDAVLTGNSGSNGAAIYNSGSGLSIINNTIYGNTAGVQGGGLHNSGTSNLTVVNTILWQNGANNIYNTGTLNITYSDVQQGSGVFAGTGNINADPLFVNAGNAAGTDGVWRTADDGFKVQPGSPAINAGIPDITGLPISTYDLEGMDRVSVQRIDIGAYESPYIQCVAGSNTLYVDGSLSQSGNGASWATAFKTFSEAITALDACPAVNTILVAGGTYYPTSSTNRDASFVIPRKGNVKIYGGYPNGGGDRDLAANPTILSGEIGAINSSADNSFHIMVIANTNAGADSVVIDGLRFTGGDARGTGSKTVNGVAVNESQGGALAFVNNNGNPRILIRNCRFENNTAAQGGAIFCTGSVPVIINSWLRSNTAGNAGGGMYNYNNAWPVLINVVITGNKADLGGAVFNENSSATFINATIAGNYASMNIGGLYNRYSSTNIRIINSIIYGNRHAGGSISNLYNEFFASSILGNTLIESASGSWQTGFGTDNGKNVFADPLFVSSVNPTNANTPNTLGDYQLQAGSPAIDAGDNAALPAGIDNDIEHAPRRQQAATDLGAFESSYFNCDQLTVETDAVNVQCFGAGNGTASVTVTRGVAPYTYNWNNGKHTASVTNLVAGN